ncbi:MFS family permease [Bradyrhizobium sp. AZCC 1678]|uniref:MFS transporter n=1 Tax=Bradyrhizobium sp. AZCC 1678 TaxID=3117030 RepID=UPI002FF011F4
MRIKPVQRISTAAEPISTKPRESSSSGWRTLFSRELRLRSLLLMGPVTLHAFYMFITATVMPAVVAEIGGDAYYAWVPTLFGISSTVGAFLVPAYLRKLTPRAMFVAGVIAFVIGSALCATALSIDMVIWGRILQGLAGGWLAATATSIIPVVFPADVRAKAIALVSSVWGPLALASPLVGGLLAGLGQWRASFWLAFPLASAIGILAWLQLPSIPPQDDARRSRFPAIQLILVVGASLVLSIASIPGQAWAAASGTILAAAFLVIAVWADGRNSSSVLIEGAFRISTEVGRISTFMFLLVLGTGAGGFLPLILARAQGASTLLAGYIAAFSSLAWAVAALVSASRITRLPNGVPMVVPLLVAVAMLGVGFAIDAGSAPVTGLMWALYGGSVGAVWPHLAARLIASAAPNSRALAGSSITTLQILAGTFGAAIAGIVANLSGATSTTPSEVAHGGQLLFLSFGLAPLLALLIALRISAADARD